MTLQPSSEERVDCPQPGRVIPARATLDRRRLLVAGGALLASCRTGTRLVQQAQDSRLDRLLDAHSGLLPERPGAGANHYPMAAEALDALGHEDAIDDAWIEGASLYVGKLGREGALDDRAERARALGRYERFGDWLDHFRSVLRREPWRTVVAHWAPHLAPAISAAAFHGVIRTGHAVRALGSRDTLARRNELAAGLAYWAARYVELPTKQIGDESLRNTLANLSHRHVHERGDVEFSEVMPRLTEFPFAPPVAPESAAAARTELEEIVREAAIGFLEMLVLERNRIWLLHTITGPAAVQWLLPVVDRAGAHRLVQFSRQAVVAMYGAFGEPFTARAHLHESPPDWPTQIQRAVDSRSVHGIKLIDALVRFDRDHDPVWRSVAAQWFKWV